MAGAEAKTRPGIAGVRFLSILTVFAPAPATAGAWLAPEGGQQIWTSVAGEREGVSFFESSAYFEAPVGDATSVVVAPWVEQGYETVDGWRAEATIGAKRALYRDDANVVALQAGAVWMSHPGQDCSEGGAELRLLAGRGFGRSGFANVEIATRAFEGGCESDRLDLSVGYRPAENWLAMGQVFVDAYRDEDEPAIRAQLTMVNFRPSGRGFQFGVRGRVDGEAEEVALILGWWGRVGD